MNKKVITFMGLLLMVLMINNGSASTAIDVTGSNTLFPIMEAAGARFQELHQDVKVSVSGPGSGAGIKALINKQTDIAPMSRAPKDSELTEAKNQGLQVKIETVGKDALIIIVNKDNPLNDLTTKQISDIFAGNVTSWKDLGWATGGDITVIERDENSGTHDFFNEHFLDGNEVDPTKVKAHKQEASTSTLFKLVKENPNAIGYGGLAYLTDIVKAVSVDGTAPSKASAADGSYAVARPLFLVYDELTIGDLAKQLVDYVLSPEGQWIVDDVGYVAVKEMATGLTSIEGDSNSVPGFGFFAAFLSVLLLPIIKKRK